MGRTIIMDGSPFPQRPHPAADRPPPVRRGPKTCPSSAPTVTPRSPVVCGRRRLFQSGRTVPDPGPLPLPDALHSRGVPLEKLGVPRADGGPVEEDPRKIWRLFAGIITSSGALPAGCGSKHVLYFLFGLDQRGPTAKTRTNSTTRSRRPFARPIPANSLQGSSTSR